MSTVETKLNELRQTREERKVDAYERYMQLVHDTCDGKDVDADAAAETLDDFGKTCEQLEQDVQTLVKRRSHRAVIDAAPARDAEMGENEEKLQKLWAEKERLVSKLDFQIHECLVIRDSVQGHVWGVQAATTFLRDTAWPHLKEKVEAIRRELKSKGEGTQDLEYHIRGLEGSLNSKQRELAGHEAKKLPGTTKQKIADLKQAISHLTKQLDESRQRLAEKKAIIDECANRWGEAEREILVP